MGHAIQRVLGLLLVASVAVTVLSACAARDGQRAAPSVSSTASASQTQVSPVQSSSAASPSRTLPPASPPPTVAGALCELPVYGLDFEGFVAIPGGSFTASPENSGEFWLPLSDGRTYSATLRTWLPVRPQAVSPDGTRFVWIDYLSSGDQQVHVVDAVTMKDAILVHNGDLDFPQWQPDGIYLLHHRIGTDFAQGLVRLDPATGAVTAIAVPGMEQLSGWLVNSGGAWSTDFSPGPLTDVARGADRLRRLDLVSGRVDTWFFDVNREVSLQGFDFAGNPIIGVLDWNGGQPSNPRILRLTQPNVGTTLWAADLAFGMSVTADAHGLWFVLVNVGIWWLGNEASQPEKVSSIGVYGTGGPCI